MTGNGYVAKDYFSPHMRGYFWFQQNAVGLAGRSCIRVSADPAGQI